MGKVIKVSIAVHRYLLMLSKKTGKSIGSIVEELIRFRIARRKEDEKQ